MSERVSARHSAEEMLRHREIQRTSNLTIEAYCKREGIKPSTWWYWRNRILTLKNKRTVSASPVSFLRLPVSSQDIPIELTLPNGSRVKVPATSNPTLVRQVVRMLAELRPS